MSEDDEPSSRLQVSGDPAPTALASLLDREMGVSLNTSEELHASFESVLDLALASPKQEADMQGYVDQMLLLCCNRVASKAFAFWSASFTEHSCLTLLVDDFIVFELTNATITEALRSRNLASPAFHPTVDMQLYHRVCKDRKREISEMLERQRKLAEDQEIIGESYSSGLAIIGDITVLFSQERLILHLYSGRRRYGDVQACLEWCNVQSFRVVVVSVDLAVSKDGDLSNKANRPKWLQAAASGLVCGSIQGPPCETWSAARWQELLDTLSRGPRPLRSNEQPWGLQQGLTAREIGQLHLANVLLTFSFDMMVALLGSGGFSLTEHPAQAWWNPLVPSIWKLDVTAWLKISPAIRFWTFRQGLHGQLGSKPTTFMALRLSSIGSYLYKPQCPIVSRSDSAPLIGRTQDASGKTVFRTAAAKEYPVSLCLAIARAVHDALNAAKVVHEPSKQEDLRKLSEICQQMVVASDPYEVATEIGADCMLHNRN